MTFVTPNPERVWGIDISGRWDGNVDFSATKRAGASFVIIKCIDGTVPTRLWKENRQRAIGAGLFVGDYAWLYRDGDVSCKGQALATWNLIENEPRQIPIAIDFEWTKFMGSASNPDYSDLDKWVTEFTRLSGYKPGFYSAAGYMNDFGVMPLSLRRKFAYFWVANYGVLQPGMPRGFDAQDWQFWQFAATGDATVIAPSDTGKLETDLNYWNGDLPSFRQYFNLDAAPDEPTEPEPGAIMADYQIVWDNGANERKGPSTWDAPTGKIYAQGEIIKVAEVIVKTIGVEVWGKLGEGRYVALVYNGQERAKPVLPPPAVSIKHTIKVYSDGSIQVDDGAIIA
jgi:GH25 family lysozyme M1 (1,4-beta-N-acetylmuramidase)